jgi:hypothetical protein
MARKAKTVKAQQAKKKQILKAFADLNKENKRRPTMEDLVAKGYTKDSIKHHYSSLGKLEEEARKSYPASMTLGLRISSLISLLQSSVSSLKSISDLLSLQQLLAVLLMTISMEVSRRTAR